MTLEQLGEAMNVSPQAVSQWETGRSSPTIFSLVTLAKVLQVDLTWLLHGLHEEELLKRGGTPLEVRSLRDPWDVDSSAPTQGILLPKIRPEQVLKDTIDRTTEEYIYSHFPCSNLAFALSVFDRANEPVYQPGDIIIIDPTVTPLPGMMVLCRYAGPQAIFGQHTWTGHPRAVEVKFLNTDYGTARLAERKGHKVIGVLTEHIRQGPSSNNK